MPFRFWAAVTAVADARALGEWARKAEALGFDGLFVYDHLGDRLAPLPALAAHLLRLREITPEIAAWAVRS